MKKPVIRRLSEQTIRSGPNSCWLHKGAPCCKFGYVKISYLGKKILIHRLAYELFNGIIPTGMNVLHLCIGNPNCWNPDHLYCGTQKDNVRDCREQGRIWDRRGQRNGLAKLNDDKVRQIRASPITLSSRILSKKFGVSPGVIRHVRQHRTWKHV